MRGFLSDPAIAIHTRVAGALSALFPLLFVIGSAPADIGAGIVSVIFIYESYRQKRWAWCARPWVLCMWALWSYFTLRGAFAEDPFSAVFRALAWIRYPLFAAALAFYTLRFSPVRAALLAMLSAALAFIMADALLQYFWGRDVFGRLPLMSAEGSLRLTGPFKDPKVGIVLAWLGIPVLAGLAQRRTWQAALCAAALALMVFLSGERMALLLTGFGFVLLALSIRALRMPLIGAAMAGLLAAGIFSQAYPELVERQYASTLTTIGNFRDSPYGLIWQSTIRMIETHPVFGVGGRHFRIMCPDPAYGPAELAATRCNLHPHQLYLEWWAEGGLVALVLFIALLICLVRDALRGFSVNRGNMLYMALLVALCIRIWPLSTSTGFFVAWSALPFWLIAGWLLAISYGTEEKR